MKFETARIHFFGAVFAAVRFFGRRPAPRRKPLVAREKKPLVPRVSLSLKLPNTQGRGIPRKLGEADPWVNKGDAFSTWRDKNQLAQLSRLRLCRK